MKSMKMLFIGLLLVLAFLAGRRLLASEKVPEPTFKSLAKLGGGVEVREYPSLVVAKTGLRRNSLGDPANEGFRKVARYLFGGNERSESMAMTAPVVMDMGEQPTLYFYMPFDRSESDLPATRDRAITLQTLPPRTLGVLRFGGYASDKDLKRYGRRLREILEQEGWRVEGPLLYMGYNAPWTLIGRRNEVAYQVRRSS
ncbi:MAG: heme-binding protein [Bacteroidetes bacterium]|nr:heme-binding protein [Bacteroidota bacterium]